MMRDWQLKGGRGVGKGYHVNERQESCRHESHQIEGEGGLNAEVGQRPFGAAFLRGRAPPRLQGRQFRNFVDDNLNDSIISPGGSSSVIRIYLKEFAYFVKARTLINLILLLSLDPEA
jgi:hypothetical protein